MRTIHRVSVASSSEISGELSAFGVLVKPSGLVTFTVEESEPRWPQVRDWIQRRGAADLAIREFSSEEERLAPWLEPSSDWHAGYPQPEEGRMYLSQTYDESSWCPACGVGGRQVREFRMAGEPAWDGRGVTQLHWVFDELFVIPEVWRAVFKPAGVGSRPVLNTDGSTLATVLQLAIEEEVDVDVTGLTAQICRVCGLEKYPANEGFAPCPVPPEAKGELVRSRQWFGSGGRGFRLVLLSQGLREALTIAQVRGASFRPCRLS